MATFTSKARSYSIRIDGKTYQFEHFNYSTKDEKEIEALRNSPAYQISYNEFQSAQLGKNNIVAGIRTGDSQPILGESELEDIKKKTAENTAKELVAKFKRYDELKPLVKKLNGENRQDATPEDIQEFEELKKILE